MRIEQLSPTVTPFKAGRTRRAGNWRAEDDTYSEVGESPYPIRDVYHYGTRMVRYICRDGVWDVERVSLGRGSVSDQGGMRKLIGPFGYRYRRAGGARIVRFVDGIEREQVTS